MKKILFVVLLILMSACQRVATSVSSFAEPYARTKNHYAVMPGNKGVQQDDLEYKEYVRYLDCVMEKAGYYKSYDNYFDVVVYYSYGMSDPQVKNVNYTTPIYGQTGVSSSTTVGTLNNYGGVKMFAANPKYSGGASYTETTTYTPTYGVTGYQNHVKSVTTYKRFVVLDAYEYNDAKKGVGSNVWKVMAESEGAEDDLRLIMPYMLYSAIPYIGISSGGRKVNVEVMADDKNIDEIRKSK